MNFRTCWAPHYIPNFGIQWDATILIYFLTVLAYHSKVKNSPLRTQLHQKEGMWRSSAETLNNSS